MIDWLRVELVLFGHAPHALCIQMQLHSPVLRARTWRCVCKGKLPVARRYNFCCLPFMRARIRAMLGTVSPEYYVCGAHHILLEAMRNANVGKRLFERQAELTMNGKAFWVQGGEGTAGNSIRILEMMAR